MTQEVIRRYLPVHGMNTIAPQREMDVGYAPNLTNLWYYDGLSLRKRPGLVWQGATTGQTQGAFIVPKATSSTTILHLASGVLATYDGATVTNTAQSFSGSRVGAATLKDKTIFGDAINAAMYWNGTAFTAPTYPTASGDVGDNTLGNIFHTHRGRVYCAGNKAFPATVFVSDTITNSGVSYWSQQAGASSQQGDFIDVSADLSEPDTITGIVTHRGNLIILCSNHILVYAVVEKTGAVSGITATLLKSIKGDGCLDARSIQPVGEEVYFLSPNGFKRLTVSLIQGDSQVLDLSISINNVVKDAILGGVTTVSSTYVPKYGLYLCTLGSAVYGFQTTLSGWFKWTNTPSLLFADAKQNMYAFNSGGILKFDTTVHRDEFSSGTYTAITSRYTPIPFRSLAVAHKPRWERTELLYETNAANDSIEVQYYFSLNRSNLFTGTWPLTPDATLEDGSLAGTLKLPITGRDELLGIDFIHSQNTDFKINIVEVYYVDGGPR